MLRRASRKIEPQNDHNVFKINNSSFRTPLRPIGTSVMSWEQLDSYTEQSLYFKTYLHAVGRWSSISFYTHECFPTSRLFWFLNVNTIFVVATGHLPWQRGKSVKQAPSLGNLVCVFSRRMHHWMKLGQAIRLYPAHKGHRVIQVKCICGCPSCIV